MGIGHERTMTSIIMGPSKESLNLVMIWSTQQLPFSLHITMGNKYCVEGYNYDLGQDE